MQNLTEHFVELIRRTSTDLPADVEQALRDAGAPDGWMVRPHVDKPKALCIVGTFAPPWDEARVVEVLRPVAGSYEIVCFKRP